MTGIKWTETGGPRAVGNGADGINQRIDHADAIPTDSPDGELPALGRHTLKEHKAAVHNAPDRWLFDERDLASVLKGKHQAPFSMPPQFTSTYFQPVGWPQDAENSILNCQNGEMLFRLYQPLSVPPQPRLI